MTAHSPVVSPDASWHGLPPIADEIVVERTSGWPAVRFRELWGARELLYFLVWRDVKVRYKQTALGVAWAVLQPLLTVVVLTVFFNRVAKITTGDIPYPVFTLAGLVPWLFFANGLTLASGSLVSSANVVTKIYFPRLVIPIATMLSGLPDFGIAFAMVIVVAAGYGIAPTLAIVVVPLVLLLVLATGLGASMWLSALNVEYRDVRFIVPVAMQLWLLATPIAYPTAGLHDPWREVLGLNPMAGAVEAFRWAIVGSSPPPVGLVGVSVAVGLGLLVSGAYYFRAMERRFADII
jgi:lipopolysaccharide transport system permease protein